MLVRGPSLATSMSSYLIDRIAATENIEVLTDTELNHVAGSLGTGVESVGWRNRNGTEERPIRNVFLFLGADPSTEWLESCDVDLDDKGFVITGRDASLPLQTSVPGVFAIGDVRAGSVKRVAAPSAKALRWFHRSTRALRNAIDYLNRSSTSMR